MRFQPISPSKSRGLTKGHRWCNVIIKYSRFRLPFFFFSFFLFTFLPHEMFLHVRSMHSVLLFMHSITHELFSPEKQTDGPLASMKSCCCCFLQMTPPPSTPCSQSQETSFIHYFLPVATMEGYCEESRPSPSPYFYSSSFSSCCCCSSSCQAASLLLPEHHSGSGWVAS